MGNRDPALYERKALHSACARGNVGQLLTAWRDLHWLKLDCLDDDLVATAALTRIGDRRASLAAAQLAARLTQILRLDMEGLDELLSDLDGLPETREKIARLTDEAEQRLAGTA